MYNNCNEGTIYNLYAPFSLYNSTFMYNTAERGGGVYNNKGNMKIYNSMFLYNHECSAGMAELADAHGSGPCESNFMRVQVPLPALESPLENP